MQKDDSINLTTSTTTSTSSTAAAAAADSIVASSTSAPNSASKKIVKIDSVSIHRICSGQVSRAELALSFCFLNPMGE
jgi:hypothetical protein